MPHPYSLPADQPSIWAMPPISSAVNARNVFPERALWRAAILEAYDRRRHRPTLRHCFACGRELGYTDDPPEARRPPCPTCHPFG